MRIADYLKAADEDGDLRDSAGKDTQNGGESERSVITVEKGFRTRRWKLASRLFSFSWKCGSGRMTGREEEIEDEEGDATRGGDGGEVGGTTPGRSCEVRVTASQSLSGGYVIFVVGFKFFVLDEYWEVVFG